MRATLRSEIRNPKSAILEIAFVTDDEIARLNTLWLDHRGPTDVLTFPLSEAGSSQLEGQIVISLDTARREAAARGHAWQAEALLYVVHGVLHLLGHDDRTARQQARMHRIEDAILTSLGLGPVYHARR